MVKKSVIPNSPNDEKVIHDFLKSQAVGVLTTVSPRNKPHGVVVYFSIDEKFGMYFMTKADTEKNKNIKHNNQVMLVVYEASSQTTVQVTGHAVNISDLPEGHKVFADTLKSAQQTSDSAIPPISKLDAGRYYAYKIVPEQIRMAVFARPDPGSYEQLYQILNF